MARDRRNNAKDLTSADLAGSPSAEGGTITMDSSTDSAAARWLGVRILYEKVSGAWTAATATKTICLLVITVGLSLLWYEPRRRCAVSLFRLDDDSEVRRFRYNSAEEADDHASSLRERLANQHVYDFCRELGLDTGQIVGPGSGPSTTLDGVVVEWVEVDRRRLGG